MRLKGCGMGKKRKKIAFFGMGLTSRYKRGLTRVFTLVAEELDLDLVVFNTYGRIGNDSSLSDDYELDFLSCIDLDQFDGIVFDGDGYAIDGAPDLVEAKLRQAKCPVVSISTHVEGFYNIDFRDAGGLRMMVEHLIDHHHLTKIGFMSGYLTHPDAQSRLEEFQTVMREHGLPENGVGMFEGDFWYDKGMDAARYFLSLPERPEAIVCANDYMAISLCNALRKLGIRIPDEIAVTGFDGSIEGQEFLPHLTSVTRERMDVARKSLGLLVKIIDGEDPAGIDLTVSPKAIYGQSCGCEPLDYEHVLDIVARVHDEQRLTGTKITSLEVAMLRMNQTYTVREMERVFAEKVTNFGDYNSFFLMVHVDENGMPSYSGEYTKPSGKFQPAIWIDKKKEYIHSSRTTGINDLIPEADSERSHVYYVMGVRCADMLFGYSIVEMTGKEIFDEFYNVWMMDLGMTINDVRKNDRISKLINKLEGLSVTDDLTGMLNRRGFEDKSRSTIMEFSNRRMVCTIVIDMDGLKRINDVYGHYEGDRAIKALAEMIKRSCENGEIAGRVGGDEFYIFAVDYSERCLERFIEHMKEYAAEFNASNGAGYQLDFSYGSYLTEMDAFGKIEEYLKISDGRMYEQKMTKPGRRK